MEATVSALKTKLVDDFPTFLSDYDIEGPKKAIFGDVDLTRNQTKVTAFILPDEETFEETTTELDTVEQKFDIFLFFRGKTKEELTTDCLRAVRAFRSMLQDDDTLGGEVGYIHLDKADYIEGVEGNDGIKGIRLTVKVLTEE